MSVPLKLAFAGLWRTPVATLVRILVLGMATALLGSMILFVGHSLNTMTGSAVRGVPLDWQGPVGSYAADLKVAAGVARQPGVLQASPAATALTVPSPPAATTIDVRALAARAASAGSCPRRSSMTSAWDPAAWNSSAMSAFSESPPRAAGFNRTVTKGIRPCPNSRLTLMLVG